MAIPLLDGSGFRKETIQVEYEWQPPRCDTCKIFGHMNDQCPKLVKAATSNVVNDGSNVATGDGFTQVKRKNGKGKQSVKQMN